MKLPRTGRALLLALLLAACREGPATPVDALRALQEAEAAGDATGVLALHDADSRAYYTQAVRTMRARVAAGEAAADVLPEDPDARADYLDGSLEEAAGHWALRNDRVGTMFEELGRYTVLATDEQPPVDGRESADVRVRAANGDESTLHFLREPDGWKYDSFRHLQERLNPR